VYAANVGLQAKVKEHKDWKAGRRKPPGIDGMEAGA
jgi:hypothetical protein